MGTLVHLQMQVTGPSVGHHGGQGCEGRQAVLPAGTEC